MGTSVLNYLNPWSARIDFEGLNYPKTSVAFNDEEERKRRQAEKDALVPPPVVETKQDTRKSEMEM